MDSRWYVLNHIATSANATAQKAVDRHNAAFGCALELFAPTYIVREERDGEIRYRTARLTFHYVFVRGTLADVRSLCAQPNGFSFLIDRGNAERYATIDDRTMAGFRNIAAAYKNCLPFFSLEDIELEDGDLVEVVNGDFPGLTGTYMPNPRCKTGNIVLSIYNNVGTIVFNVKATDVRVLEFSRRSTRANDQIDAFEPHLIEALGLWRAARPLPASLASKLAVFTGRLTGARLNNRKLDARLQILLHAAHRILGNSAEARAALDRYERLRQSVTNDWTHALHALILAALDGDTAALAAAHARLASLPAASAQRLRLVASASQLVAESQESRAESCLTAIDGTMSREWDSSRLQ